MSSLFSSALFLLILLTLNPILSSHIRAGCLSWKLKLSQRDKRKEIEEAEDRSPDWCRDSLLSLRLEKEGQAQKGPHPFVIRTQSFKMSNAIRVRVKCRNGTGLSFSEVLIQARDSNGYPVGKFYPYPPDGDLNCCNNPYDLNTVRVDMRKRVVFKDDVNFLWIPSGHLDDFLGPFRFRMTLGLSNGKYWTGIESKEVVAQPKVEL